MTLRQNNSDIWYGQSLYDLVSSCGFSNDELRTEAMTIVTFESGDSSRLREIRKEEGGELSHERLVAAFHEGPDIFNGLATACNKNDPRGGSVGLFQINGFWRDEGHKDRWVGSFNWDMGYDPRYNVTYAHKLYVRSGWQPWSTAKWLPEKLCQCVTVGDATCDCVDYPDPGNLGYHNQSMLWRLPPPDSRFLCEACLSAFRNLP